jgi:murein DD-endopeptidase MepM/ murein hydrolase activator NlpD
MAYSQSVGAFIAGLRLGVVVVLTVLGASAWWRVARSDAPTPGAPRPAPAGLPTAAPATDGTADAPARVAPISDADVERLRSRRLVMPVEGFDLSRLRDGFNDPRQGHVHAAIELLAPRGTRIRAVDDGVVRRLITTGRGGISIYQFDAEGRYCYFYAHLDRYAAFLSEGKAVRKGEVLGFVGSTGNAAGGAPHLHFAIFRLDDDAKWWSGTPVNPFPVWAPDRS